MIKKQHRKIWNRAFQPEGIASRKTLSVNLLGCSRKRKKDNVMEQSSQQKSSGRIRQGPDNIGRLVRILIVSSSGGTCSDLYGKDSAGYGVLDDYTVE